MSVAPSGDVPCSEWPGALIRMLRGQGEGPAMRSILYPVADKAMYGSVGRAVHIEPLSLVRRPGATRLGFLVLIACGTSAARAQSSTQRDSLAARCDSLPSQTTDT